MATLPPELTSAALATLGVAGTWFASWLARKGKREDTKIAQANQTFAQLQAVAEERRRDNEVLKADIAALRAENERVRLAWEGRWERQMVRCRSVTDSLVNAIAALRKIAGAEAAAEAESVLRHVADHNQDDHDVDTGR